ncbi:MAG: YidC/Oxa1 family membrane protein insertase [Vampirovibrionia bacterium]
MDWTLLTIQILETLKNFFGSWGSWGLAIILLTLIVRSALIPLSVSQQRSMKKMQELSPKLKQLQQKYKSDPQKLQLKMMEFYKENKFNPLGGCFPLLLQMPIFILLYTTLISPVFLQKAGPESFLFVNRLDGTLQTYSNLQTDGTFSIKEKDTFITGKYNVKVFLKDGKEVTGQIDDYRNALKVEPKPLKPGEQVHFNVETSKISFHHDTVDIKDIESATIPIVDNNSKEIEPVHFTLDEANNMLNGSAETIQAKTTINIGVCILLLLFAITMWLSQKIMMNMSSATALDPQQKAMQETMSKMMPLMILAMFVIIPIPAGVLLYMVVSNVFQVGQTFAINKYLEVEKGKVLPNKDTIIDVKAEEKKEIDADEDEDNSPVKKISAKKVSRRQRKKRNKN